MVVSIDTECDKGPDWEIQRPLRFRSVIEGIPRVLMPLFERYGVKPTFLLSPEVIQNDECVKVLSTLDNCELGTHLHGEFVEPQADSAAARTHTPQLLYAPGVERAKLTNLTNLFEDRFGYRPTSFRAGRFGLSEHTLCFLSELGYLVDSSVTPFRTHYFEGRAVRNYWGAPLQPYFPLSWEVRRPGKLSVLEVPVTIINPLLMRWPKWVLRHMSDRTRWHKRMLGRLGKRVPEAVWLRPQRSTPEQLIAAADTAVRACSDDGPVVLNMMYHSVEIIPGASPYAQTKEQVLDIVHSQEALFEHLRKNYRFHSHGLSELREFLSR